MIILGLFLIHLAEAVAAFAFFKWLVHWFGGATIAEAALMFTAVAGAVTTLIVLVAKQRVGVVIAVAIIVFWSLVVFGAEGTTAINILAVAVAALVVAAAMTLMESFVVRRRAARNPP